MTGIWKSGSWCSVLALSAEGRTAEAINHASTYQVLRLDELEFEVISADQSDIVNIGSHSCSCRDWQLYGIPCSHAVVALISCRKDVYAYTAKCFTAASHRDTYVETLHPIPGKIEWKKTDESCLDNDIIIVRPPKFRRPPGRPGKKRSHVKNKSLSRFNHFTAVTQSIWQVSKISRKFPNWNRDKIQRESLSSDYLFQIQTSKGPIRYWAKKVVRRYASFEPNVPIRNPNQPSINRKERNQCERRKNLRERKRRKRYHKP